jgi:hypothetical protein
LYIGKPNSWSKYTPQTSPSNPLKGAYSYYVDLFLNVLSEKHGEAPFRGFGGKYSGPGAFIASGPEVGKLRRFIKIGKYSKEFTF